MGDTTQKARQRRNAGVDSRGESSIGASGEQAMQWDARDQFGR
jgi:hypothetical protein